MTVSKKEKAKRIGAALLAAFLSLSMIVAATMAEAMAVSVVITPNKSSQSSGSTIIISPSGNVQSSTVTNKPTTNKPTTSTTTRPAVVKKNYTFSNIAVTNSSKTLSSSTFSRLNSLISNYRNTYGRTAGVYVINLKDGMTFSYNANKYIFAASTVKLPFEYYCYSQIANGKVSLNATKRYDERFRRGGTGVMKNYRSGGYWTMRTLLDYTVRYSDNVAYYMILEHFGHTGYNQMLKSHGFNTYINNYTKFGSVSPRLLATYWQKIYQNQKAKPTSVWNNLLTSAKNTTWSPIRSALGNKTVANKSGWATASFHDSGIVYGQNPYVVVVMTTGEGYNSDQTFVANVVKEVDKIITAYNN